jgi:hypothetical protein
MSKDADVGLFVEVDIEAPWWLHDELDDYPGLNLVRPGAASPWMLKHFEHQAKQKPCPKLIMDLEPKKQYLMHYRLLQVALRIGWEVTAVHRVMSFQQDAFLRRTMLSNTAARLAARAAGNEFLAYVIKTDSNILFGKMLEDVLKRCNCELALTGMQLNRNLHSHRFKGATEITPSLAMCHMGPKEARIATMVPAGVATLDMAKAHMTDFIHVLKRRFGKQVSIVYGDTDSVFVKFVGVDPYVALLREPELRKHFDCSGFAKDSPFYDDGSKGGPGLFKFEYGTFIILTFVGIKPKAYALALLDNPTMSTDPTAKYGLGDEVKKAKGGSKHVTDTQTAVADFRACVEHNLPIVRGVTNIVSKKFQTATVTVERQIACGYEDKRFWINATQSRAHGHWRNQLDVQLAALGWGPRLEAT